MVARRAAEYETTSAIRYFATEYRWKTELLPLKEKTVRRLKDLYKEQLHVKGNIPSVEDFAGFATKKNGRPLKIGEDLDKQVREYIIHLRSTGTSINTTVVIASAEGILMHENADLLSRIDFNKGWAQYLLHRMGYVKHKVTTKAKVTVENFTAVKEDYLLEIKQVITMDEIPAELIINFDQTGLSIVPSSDWTMEAKGAKWVEAVGKDDKRQLTAVLAGTLTGDFLPPQIIYQRKMPRCLPKYSFPEKWHITYSINHWSNEDTMKEYVLLQYITEKRQSLGLAIDYPALVIFDNFKAQCIPAILTQLDQNSINVLLVPPNCTD